MYTKSFWFTCRHERFGVHLIESFLFPFFFFLALSLFLSVLFARVCSVHGESYVCGYSIAALVRVWSLMVMIEAARGLVSCRFRAIGQALLTDSSLFPRDVVPVSCLLLMAINGVSGPFLLRIQP